jgi:hypothetical protein
MSDSAYISLCHLKDQRKKDMAKNYCHRFVQDVMKKYDSENTGILLVSKLQNECSKHKPACIQHFNEKYVEIVQEILGKEHRTGFVDKMQLFEECKVVYDRLKREERERKHPGNFI